MTKEDQLHYQVCQYIRMQYPWAIFNTDLSGVRLTPGLAKRVSKLRSGRAFPDLVIYERTAYNSAVFIELKILGSRLRKMNGDWASDHIREQAEMMAKLGARGYECRFAIGFDQAKEIIDHYMDRVIRIKP